MDKPSTDSDTQQLVTKLQTLRDEIRVRLHLASLDIKQEWDKLDPQVAELEKLSHEASDAVKEKAHALMEKLHALRSSLTDKPAS